MNTQEKQRCSFFLGVRRRGDYVSYGKLVIFLLFYVTYAMVGVTGSLFLFALFSFAGVEDGLNSANQNGCLST